MNTSAHPAFCSGCGLSLEPGHAGPCPKCGDTRKTFAVSLHGVIKPHASLSWKHTHEFYEKHKIFLPVVIGISLVSPFLGLVLAGWWGVIVGLLIGIATFFLGLLAVTKVREIREGHEP